MKTGKNKILKMECFKDTKTKIHTKSYRLDLSGQQGFGMAKDENSADLYLRSIVFSFESGHL